MKTTATLASASIRSGARNRASFMLTAIAASVALVLAPVIATPAVAVEEPTEVVAPATASLSGSLVVGESLSVETGAWTPADAELSYVWWQSPEPYAAPVGGVDQNDEGVVIDGATGPELALDASLEGRFVWAVVTGSAPALTSASVVAAASAKIALPSIDGVPDVAITGTPVVGAPLAAATATPLPEGVGVSFQWLRSGAPIDGAVASGYTPVAADALATLTVVATYTADGYAPATRTSAGVVIGKGTFSGAPTATLSGAVRVGSPVTAVTGAWPDGTTFTFSWRIVDAKGVEIVSKTTAQVYTPSTSILGRTLSVVITGTVPGHNPVSTRSAAVKIGAGVFTSAPTPTISGSAAVGSTLKANAGTWAPTATIRYQWKRNGASIPGATGSSYRLTSSDNGKKITVTVTAQRTAFATKTRTSAETATVTKPFVGTTPKISGTPRVGTALTVVTGTWSPTPSFRYQWKRNGVAITGATAKSFTPTVADLGAKFTVTVTASRSGYFTRVVTSASTTAVTPATTLASSGLFTVGVDIAPGTYYGTGGNDCYFERRANTDIGSEDGLLGYHYLWEGGFGGQKVVTISPGDEYFFTQSCGTWRKLSTSLRTKVGDGTWVVGSQIQTGVWQAVGPFDSDGCVVLAHQSFTGVYGDDILGGLEIEVVGTKIVLEPGLKGFTTDGCGTWKRISG